MKTRKKLKIIKFIKGHKNWREILPSPPYNLIIRDDFPYTLIKYNQIFSDFKLEIVREARGLIIKDEKIVCMPYTKFFNIGDPNAKSTLNKLSHRKQWHITEKIDGSLIKLWFDDYWHVSTNGIIDASKAELQFPNDGINNFKDMFMSLANKLINFDKLDKQYTYLFELVGMENKVIVTYTEDDIYYLGRINNYTLMETPYSEDKCEGLESVKRPKHYVIDNINPKLMFKKLQNDVNKLTKEDEHFEGVVLSDNKLLSMVKIKSDSYMELFHQKGNGVFTSRKILTLILEHKDDDIISTFPEYKQQFDVVRQALYEWVNKIKIDLLYIKNNHWEDRKEFAEWAKTASNPSIMFFAYGQDCLDDEWLEDKIKRISIDNLLNFIGLDVRKEYNDV